MLHAKLNVVRAVKRGLSDFYPVQGNLDLARRVLGKVPSYFDVEKFDVTVEQRDNALGQRVTVSLAVVKVKVDGERLISAAEGNGPVNALDLALRKEL